MRLCIWSLAVVALNSMVMSLLVFWLRRYVLGFGSLVAVSIRGLLIYVAMAFVNKTFTQEERRVVNSIIGKRVFPF